MINFPTVPTKYLIDTISPSNSSFRVNNIERWPKNNDVADDLTPSDFGDTAYAVFKDLQNTKLELMEIDPTTISQTSISIRKRGLKFYGNTLIEDSDLQQTWRGGQTLVELGSNPPQQIERATEFEKTYITQTGHGFSIGDILKSNGNNNEYEKAQADNEANAEGALGIVVQIIDSDNFVMIQRGIVENGVPAEAPGTLLYLDPNTAGAMTSLQPNVSKALAVVVDNGNKMVFDPSIGLSSSGSAGSVSSNAINQTGHGFTQGDIIRVDSANTYSKAQADSAANAEVVGIVTEVVDVDNFKYSKVIIDYTGSGIPSDTPNSAVFLDPSTPGAMTTTKPTNVGEVVKPLGVIVDSGAKMDFYPYVGHVVVGSGVVGGNKLDINTTDVTVANTTTETDVYAPTVEANVLSNDNGVKGRTYFSNLDMDASGGTATQLTLRVKYGGTTFGTATITNNSSVAITGAKGYIEYELFADNSTGAQKGNIYAVVVDATDDTGATVDAFDDDNGAQDKNGLVTSIDNNSISVDSTQDQVFSVTAEWNGASAGGSVTKSSSRLEVITDNMTLDALDSNEVAQQTIIAQKANDLQELFEPIGLTTKNDGDVMYSAYSYDSDNGTGIQERFSLERWEKDERTKLYYVTHETSELAGDDNSSTRVICYNSTADKVIVITQFDDATIDMNVKKFYADTLSLSSDNNTDVGTFYTSNAGFVDDSENLYLEEGGTGTFKQYNFAFPSSVNFVQDITGGLSNCIGAFWDNGVIYMVNASGQINVYEISGTSFNQLATHTYGSILGDTFGICKRNNNLLSVGRAKELNENTSSGNILSQGLVWIDAHTRPDLL